MIRTPNAILTAVIGIYKIGPVIANTAMSANKKYDAKQIITASFIYKIV